MSIFEPKSYSNTFSELFVMHLCNLKCTVNDQTGSTESFNLLWQTDTIICTANT